MRQRSCATRRDIRNRVRVESGPRPVSGLAPMQLPRGLWLLLYDQDAAQCSGGSTPPKGPARKAGRETGEARRGAGESGKARKTSFLGRRENRVTQLQIESNLRVKRSDPSHGANARPKAGAVPVARCWREMPCCRRANTRPASESSADDAEPGAEASLDKFRCGNGRNGPAMRPKAAPAAQSGVGEHTARESEAPNVVRLGKSAWRAPTPKIRPGHRKVAGPFCFYRDSFSARRAGV
ncbi:MAG: hypothetical protein QG602_1961 [Verrucomicrobiota bacterium]|nr:hypothetical protein [Verrucomicrobiota bacterium]